MKLNKIQLDKLKCNCEYCITSSGKKFKIKECNNCKMHGNKQDLSWQFVYTDKNVSETKEVRKSKFQQKISEMMEANKI